MNDAFEHRLRDLEALVVRLQESLALTPDSIVRDSAILRFELTFEVSWKCIQVAIRRQGFEANSPRQAFEYAFRLGWIRDELIWKKILDARNLAVHVYREELAQSLFEALPGFAIAFAELAICLRSAI